MASRRCSGELRKAKRIPPMAKTKKVEDINERMLRKLTRIEDLLEVISKLRIEGEGPVT